MTGTEPVASDIRELMGQFEDEHGPKFPCAYPRPTLKDMLLMGGLLCEIKGSLGHGRFVSWVKAEVPFSYRTAARYMQTYRAYCRLFKCDTVADLNQQKEEHDHDRH